MENNKGYHRLILWSKSKEFVKLIYKKTDNFPKSEIMGLQSQMRRASVSVVLNIVEGHKRSTQKDFLRFLNIADASLTEVEACLELALELNFLSPEDYFEAETERKEIAKLMYAFIKGVTKLSDW